MAKHRKSKDGLTYTQRISALNKTPEEVDRITTLYLENINLAHNVAKKYYKTGYWEFDDAVQIARMGLWKACLIWDPNKFKLSTLAVNVITRDFIDYEIRQKKQPDILFNFEEECVTDDLTLGDVLVDEKSDFGDMVDEVEDLSLINSRIINILTDISNELNLPISQVKMVYIIYLESKQYSDFKLRTIKFLNKQTVNDIIEMFKQKLNELIESEDNDEYLL